MKTGLNHQMTEVSGSPEKYYCFLLNENRS